VLGIPEEDLLFIIKIGYENIPRPFVTSLIEYWPSLVKENYVNEAVA
jgi:hypothetical protein